MIQGGSEVVSCFWTSSTPTPPPSPPLPCENLEFFLDLCLVLKQYITHEQYSTSLLFLLLSFIYYFRKYNGKHRNCLHTCGRLLPPPGAITRSGHQRQCYNCGKSGPLVNVCPSKYKVATKTDKREEKNYNHTNCQHL